VYRVRTWWTRTVALFLAWCTQLHDRPRWADVGRVCLPWAAATSLPAAKRDSLWPDPGSPHADNAELARRLPGGWGGQFGGFPHGTIYLTAPEHAREVVALRHLPPGVRVRRGRWDAAQLHDWYRYLTPRTGGAAVSSVGIDVAGNRIVVGVVDAAARRQLEGTLAALEIPCYLVAIGIEPRAVLGGP
jgi:hypothetical protein